MLMRIARAVSLVSLVSLSSVSLSGCWHPASREECEELFAKNVEIELRRKNITDAKLIEERTKAARATEGDKFMARCLGKPITKSALTCLRKAQTPEQADRCL